MEVRKTSPQKYHLHLLFLHIIRPEVEFKPQISFPGFYPRYSPGTYGASHNWRCILRQKATATVIVQVCIAGQQPFVATSSLILLGRWSVVIFSKREKLLYHCISEEVVRLPLFVVGNVFAQNPLIRKNN